MAAVRYLYPEIPEKSEKETMVSQAMEIARYMCEEWMMQFRPGIARGVLRYLAEGFDPALIRAVIDETSLAPSPSWAYFSAIMRRAEAERAYTLSDFGLFSRHSPKRVGAHNYTQREYTEADLLAISDDLIAEARKLRDTPPQPPQPVR